MSVSIRDVIVVGAGPAGLHFAKNCEKDLDVLVLEEHKEIGKPVQCSGLISSNLAERVRISREFVEHRVKGAILHSPSGEKVFLSKKGIAAYVIDRGKFDAWLSKQTTSEIMLGTAAKNVKVRNGFVEIKTNKGTVKSKMLIGCDGPNSVVAKTFNAKPREFIKGVLAMVPEKDSSPRVELWFNKNLSPDGFLWRIPRAGRVEYGMFSADANFKKVEKFFKLKRHELGGGVIPLGPPKTFFNRTMLIGDAAAQVKPWSGGGVVYGLTCAEIAAKVAIQAFEAGDFSEDFLRKYEELWRGEIGRDITLGMIYREIYKRVSNSMLDRLFQKVQGLGFLNRLDMDFPSRFLF